MAQKFCRNSAATCDSVRAAQMAVYELPGADRKVPPITLHDKSLRTQFEALIKAFK